MKNFILISLTFFTVQSMAATLGSGIVGGPFKGDCTVLEQGVEKDYFTFDTKPETKNGIALKTTMGLEDQYIQIINDSFNNDLSIAVIGVRQNVVNQPPLACQRFGGWNGYNSCDYRPKPWSAQDYKEVSRALPMPGPLKVDSIGSKTARVVDSKSFKIGSLNQGFRDSIELNVNDQQVLSCNIEYLNFFRR